MKRKKYDEVVEIVDAGILVKPVFDWLIDSLLQCPRVYIYTLLKELQPDMTRTWIPNLNRIGIQNDLNN